jgi:alkyl hydroperoxide reductase subunit AhpC
MQELTEKYASKGLATVFISTDRDRDAWVKADHERMSGKPWVSLHDEDRTIMTAYGVRGIPSVFLIDASGKVIFEKLHGDAIEQELKKAFGF